MALECSPIAHRTRSQNQGLVKSSTEIDDVERPLYEAGNRDLTKRSARSVPEKASQQSCNADGILPTTLPCEKAQMEQQQQDVRRLPSEHASDTVKTLASSCETIAAPSEREIAAAVAARCRLNGKKHVAAVATGKLPSGPEPAAAEVSCPPVKDLQPLKEPQKHCEAMQAGLKSKDWVELCNSLTVARRVVAYHHHLLLPTLDTFAAALLLAVKSLRSSVCKAAVMCSAETFCIFGGAMADLTDGSGMAAPQTSLLQQLLLKAASNDKRFVVEEAQAATAAFARHMPSQRALEMLLPYTGHKSPKVRGQTAKTLAIASVTAGPQQLQEFGTGRLLEACGRLISDNTPEARSGARDLLRCVKVAWQCSSEGPPDHSDIVEDDCRHTAANPGKENETKDAVYEPRQHQGKVSSVLASKQIGNGQPLKIATHRALPSRPFCPADHPVLGVSGDHVDEHAAQTQQSEDEIWAAFCRSHLNAITTTAVLRATGT